ncbi:MAG: toll/interleukin-1 receptor domain-containing protein [Nostoc sp. DedVER02]|uniref:toll/interleukin-1 receptor domain-containing protein n=1 Tax=unclassified Nostoc TaxID=2593658 RepID=UPI002AD4F053|nr:MULTISPECIES: toll/interleukin-1 receptor domain-containing protein [unclassified Nostoc]MDZ7986069.1 toll/interleukin-1 receptor domain-containing protein [Nostoc sp. DedVER02]MDZ8114277.1 toll/interleukin-1 receptor domain-containing protein [Nostoc sp. DedVER01b]
MFIFTVTADTFLKVRPGELAELAEDEKLLIQVKSVLKVISYIEEGEYYRITLQDSMKGKDIWFIRKKYVQISALRSLYKSPPNPQMEKTREIAKAPRCDTSDIKNPFELEAAQILNLRGGGRIEIEEEVIKQLKAQLQKTPTIQEGSSQPVDISKDLVDCSVFSPASVTPNDMFLVQVFVHLPEEVESVKQYAQQFDPEAKQLGVRSLGIPIKRGSELTFNLSIPKLEVDDPIQQLTWNGRADSIQFGVTVPGDITQKTVIATVTVSQNTIPLGHLKFKLSIIPSTSSTSKDPQLVGEVARYYRKAFVSYSSKDRIEVLKRVQGLAVTGIAVFQDVLSLEPGDRWEQELYRNIDECDLFLLFWSTAAKESPWVLKEVLYALERQGSDRLRSPEIIPVIIEGPPLVPPPPELQDLHFNDKLLYFMATSK